MAQKFRIVIVGGGVAGLALATRLGKTVGKSGRAEITLVDKSFAHVWKPMLHCFAAGTAANENDRISFMSQASRHHFDFWPGEISGMDRKARTITLAPVIDPNGETILEERSLEYDAVILSIGSRANDFGTPGVAEHCMFIDNLVDANGFNDRFRMELLKAFAYHRELDIAIVGGGATGTQLAAELHKALGLAALYSFGEKPPALKITLLEAGPRILPAFPEKVSQAAMKQLEAIGVTVQTSAMVSGADENGFMLKDGSRVPATLRVWAAGVKAPDVTTKFGGMKLSRSGQLEVRPTLQVMDDDNVFAMGDCAFIAEKPVAPTAQAARQQAHHLARHLPAWMDGRPLPPFVFNNKGAVVALGDYNGWGTFPGGTVFGGGWLHGLSARLVHLMLYRQHQFELYGPVRGMISCLVDWLDVFVRPAVRLD
ncbi:NAD(P)/FAD-dependent oxidoreductase [Novacetimonas pomaceti]|uniref:FAD-dependent oxidoreductase n=1 Tax=Novacetimonas pomaceti TaxID=2021998 RepID=A0A318QCJ2_9PROT|nr:NAD(P)/FAD-dependent oxidoreductase [Novacetimonas pomaceti]MBV1833028.1 NAD(P)/FAD-dependent oxidoreductase [Novacetimonas pomaceti]PYD48378.1 FAD-dependent oxidoreductase [Novacetimonas pomaceti]PYD75281.1 FAD-dependent oxidoreductase [Novacetimonas pomaceti]